MAPARLSTAPPATPSGASAREERHRAATARDLRAEARLPARGRPRLLRAPRARDAVPDAGRALRRPAALGPRVAGARGPDLSYHRRGGAAGRRPQRVEPRQPARALLGGAHPTAPPGAPHDLRPALVVPALPAADAHDHRRHHPVRPRRGRRRLPRPARHPLRPLRAQAAQRRGVRPLLPQQPRARGAARTTSPSSTCTTCSTSSRSPASPRRAATSSSRARPGAATSSSSSPRSTCCARSRSARTATSRCRCGGRTPAMPSRVCRPLGIEIWQPAPALLRGWRPPAVSDYRGGHGLRGHEEGLDG